MRRATPSHLRRGAVVRVQSSNAGPGGPEVVGADLADQFNEARKKGVRLVIGGQEYGDQEPAPRKALQRLVAAWRRRQARRKYAKAIVELAPAVKVLWEPGSNPGRKTPFFYDSRGLKVVHWRQIVTRRLGYLGTRGAGPKNGDEKRLNVAVFRVWRRRIWFKALNHHLTPSAFSTTGDEQRRRLAAWDRQVDAFVAEVNGTRAAMPVIGMGDWNAERDNPRLIAKMPRPWSWDSSGPTKGTRAIDLIGHRPHVRVSVIDRGVMPTSSDHHSPWVEYEIQPKRKKARR